MVVVVVVTMMMHCSQHFRGQIKNPAIQSKYKLIEPDATYKSFCRFTSYKNPVAAADIVQAATALLELHSKDHDSLIKLMDGKENIPPRTHANQDSEETDFMMKGMHKDTFYDAYSVLGTRNESLIKKGIQVALDIQRTIVKKASAMLDGQDSIHRYHRIYYAYIRSNFVQKSSAVTSQTSKNLGAASDGGETELIFGRPMVLARLGQFIMEVKRNQSRKEGGWTGSSLLPLVLLSERADSSFLVMGISPFATPSGANAISEEQQQKLAPLINFRQFFKLAAKDMSIKFRSNCKYFRPRPLNQQRLSEVLPIFSFAVVA